MTITYETVTPSPAENVLVRKKFMDGRHVVYTIQAEQGYLLHDNRMDWTDIDYATGEYVTKLGYTRGEKSVAASYDFAANPNEIYAVPDDGQIPPDQIFGSANNDHVVA